MFHRVDMHTMLLETATQEEGEGTPCSVVVDHIAKELDAEKGTVTFENGITIQADLIIGADGIRVSLVRGLTMKSQTDPSQLRTVGRSLPHRRHPRHQVGQPDLLPLQRQDGGHQAPRSGRVGC